MGNPCLTVGAENELKAGDARAALGLAVTVAECTDGVGLAAGVEAVAGLIGADGVLVAGSRDWMTEMPLEVRDPGTYTTGALEAVTQSWREHPVFVPNLEVADPCAHRLSDHVALREWRHRDLFNDFYRPLGMTYELSAQLAWGPVGDSCCIILHRSGRDFGGRELALLELLAPHLRAARARIVAESPAPGAAEVGDLPDEASTPAGLARSLPITAREAEVLAYLAAGRTNDGIAEELGISRHTVARHVEHVYAKLGVHNRAAATRVALGHRAAREDAG